MKAPDPFLREPPRSPRTLQGFTLAELLAVITTIGILSAFLLSAVSQARAKGLRLQCMANQHQLGIALGVYLADHSHFPVGQTTNGLGAWQWALCSTNATGILHCPLSAQPSLQFTNLFKSSGKIYPHYGYNKDGGSLYPPPVNLGLGGDYKWSDDGGYYVAAPENCVRVPSDMIVLGDSQPLLYPLAALSQRLPVLPSDVCYIAVPENLPIYGVPGVDARHSGGANMLFVDGHVEYHKLAYWTAATPEARQRWNNDHKPHL